MYRLGDDLVVRLPRRPGGAHQVSREHRWLPLLAPHLPLAIPEPIGRGVPSDDYPVPWSVYRWLDGESLTDASLTDPHRAAADLGDFVAALQRVDTTGGPPAYRGGALSTRDDYVRETLRGLDGVVDVAAATAAWDEAVSVPAWPGPPVWLHSDLMPGNLLTREGRLCAVIDFGTAGIGDPACDTMPAWMVLPAGSRETFRAHLDVDDATWARGRGWALCAGLGGVQYYAVSNPSFAALARRTILACLADRS
jgi:aminoglycoside phosphotransferase (APT) family kinase protein